MDYLELNRKGNTALKKLELKILITEIVSKEELEELANQLKEENNNFEIFYIFYYLLESDMTTGAAWAISHFKPKPQIEILGIQLKELKRLAKVDTGLSHFKIIGVWFNLRSPVEAKIIIYSDNESVKCKWIFRDLSQRTESLEFDDTLNNFKTTEGEFTKYSIDENENLKLYDEIGFFSEAYHERNINYTT